MENITDKAFQDGIGIVYCKIDGNKDGVITRENIDFK